MQHKKLDTGHLQTYNTRVQVPVRYEIGAGL